MSEYLFKLGQGSVYANLLKGNDYKPDTFYDTSISQYIAEKEMSLNKVSRTVINTMLDKISSNELVLDRLNLADHDFVLKHLKVQKQNVIGIEDSTLGQVFSAAWFEERRKRLTASNFGHVINRKCNIYPKSIIQKVLQTKSFTSNACEWGMNNETCAIKSLKK